MSSTPIRRNPNIPPALKLPKPSESSADYNDGSHSPSANSDRNVQFAVSDFSGLNSPGRARAESLETPHKQKFDKAKEINYRDNFDLSKYLRIEILGNSVSDYNEPEAPARLKQLGWAWARLYMFFVFGACICFDAFLYIFTFLVIRVLVSIFYLLLAIFYKIIGILTGSKVPSFFEVFTSVHAYDFMKGLIFVAGFAALSLFNFSWLYHEIKGQNQIKLYQLAVVCELLDKMVSVVGNDSLDALYCITKANSSDWYQYLLTAGVINVFHSILHFVYLATITAAINAADSQLLAIIVLNNFAEIKSFVFKKFTEETLNPIACNDVIEVFQLFLYMFCIGLVGILDGDPWGFYFMNFFKLVFFELLVDGVKYAYLMRKCGLNPDETFNKYEESLVEKLLSSGDRAASRSLGIAQVPLGCVFARYISIAMSSHMFQEFWKSLSSDNDYYVLNKRVALVIFVFLILCSMKVMTGYWLIGYAGYQHNIMLDRKKERIRKEN